MNYSGALKSNFTPKPEDLRLCLAHFPHSDRLGRPELIEAVEKSAKIRLCGIRTHPKGAVLALRSEEDLKKLREANAICKKTPILFTPFPEIQLPLAERGRRWRIWGIPFTTTEEELQKALTTPTCTVTAVKHESVPGRPDIRTEFATFWVREQEAVPQLQAVNGEKVRIFPAEPAKKDKGKDREIYTPPADEHTQNPPENISLKTPGKAPETPDKTSETPEAQKTNARSASQLSPSSQERPKDPKTESEMVPYAPGSPTTSPAARATAGPPASSNSKAVGAPRKETTPAASDKTPSKASASPPPRPVQANNTGAPRSRNAGGHQGGPQDRVITTKELFKRA